MNTDIERIQAKRNRIKNFRVLISDIPAIDAVKCRKGIIICQEYWFPFIVARHLCSRHDCLDAHNPRTMTRQRQTGKHDRLGAFDINRHEMDVTHRVLTQDPIQRFSHHCLASDLESSVSGNLGF